MVHLKMVSSIFKSTNIILLMEIDKVVLSQEKNDNFTKKAV